jgi:ubiquinone/menaquinone biosynthesis C-methylase UbiE
MKNNTTSVNNIDIKFEKWFKKICIPKILAKTKTMKICTEDIPLDWEIVHEIMAFNCFDPSHSIEKIINLSRDRYDLLKNLWPGSTASEEEIINFYLESAKILPWGHGVFIPDHNKNTRRSDWLRRIHILEQLKSLGSQSIADYGAGGGHTTLSALAMGFKKVGHIEFEIFHPFLQWRLAKTENLDSSKIIFIDPKQIDVLDEKFDAVICSDVPEHVYDYNKLLRHLNKLLHPNGLLVWVSLFGEGIDCHLHPELKGREEQLLARYGFKKIAECAGNYQGFSGIFQKSISSSNKLHDECKTDIFTKKSEVYIASADRIDKVLHNKNVIESNYKQGAYSYATVIGGLSGLNYITLVKPSKIIFFDINEQMAQYCKFILELISICKSHTDFITRIFCRDVDKFNLSETLNYANQEKYLDLPLDLEILNDTINNLTKSSADIYNQYITPYHSGKPLPEIRNCRVLLPCWPKDQVVPVGGGQAFGRNSTGELVPNVNTFFFGSGWLSSKQEFINTKKIIQNAEIVIKKHNILDSGIKSFISEKYALALHISNIDDWFPKKIHEVKSRWSSEAKKQQSDLLLITSNNGVFRLNSENHCVAFESIRRWTTGSIIEVTTKQNWGFNEIERDNILLSDYIQNTPKSDTVIFHILIGEGSPISLFKSALQKATEFSKNILILEHNKNSLDWISSTTPMLSTEELVDLTNRLIRNSNFYIHDIQLIPGEKDAKRNILLVLKPSK